MLWPLGTMAALITIWELFVKLTNTPLYILPSPSKVVKTLFLEMPILWEHAKITLAETILGLLIAIVLAFILAVLMDAFTSFKLAVYPILVVTQTIPIIVMAPIFIIYMGFGMAPKVLTVVLMCFFPIAVSLTDGMAQTDRDQINLLRSFGANSLQIYTLVKLPFASPSLFSGLKVAATYSITGAVVGEWLSSNAGLGYYMLRVKNGFMLDKVFACILVIILLSLLMNGLVRVVARIFQPYTKAEVLKLRS